MIIKSSRWRLAAAASPFALALSFVAAPAAAQTTEPADPNAPNVAVTQETTDSPTEEAADTGEAIIVTGFRASLQSAIGTKKRSDQIIESVSAEDIGKLPDQSIAEAIARLPGVAAQRIPGSGRTSYLSIRGLGPDFLTTTLNGRLQTSTGDVRSVEYDQYPSEIVSGVDIYKTPNASLVGQGLVGSVDIKTIRPLNYKDPVFAVGVKGIYTDTGKLNPDSKEFGYRVNATFIDRMADDRLGIALSASYAKEPYQVKEERSWGWPTVTTPQGDAFALGGLATWNNSTIVKRLGLTGTLQYEFTPELTATIDGFYSNFKDDQARRGVELPLVWGGAGGTANTVEDGIVTSGTFTNVPSVVNNHEFRRNADLYSVGGNLAYNGDNGWRGFLDFGWSKTDRTESILETNGGTGFQAAGAHDTVDVVLRDDRLIVTSHVIDYGDPNVILITDPNGWGGGAPNGRQMGYLNNRIVDDEITQVAAQLEREFGGGALKSISGGASYVVRDKSLTPDEFYLELANGATEAAVPSEFLLDPIDSWVGLGPVITYDARGLLRSGFFNALPNTTEGVLGKAFQIKEKIASFYLMANLNQDFGAGFLTGNVGVRAEHTDQQSDGFRTTAATGLEPFSDGDKFWDVLPSANLNFRFHNDFVIRVAAAREIMRPRMDDMAANFSYGFNTSGSNAGLITGSSGNPRLRPYRATALDLNFEKYWGTKGYVALQLFWKKLHSYISRQETTFDWTGFPLPDPNATNPIGLITTPVNGQGGKLYGAEIAGTIPFETFSPALDGFGVTGWVTYTKTRIRPEPGAPFEDIPGYSRWAANGTAYFEKYGFNIRGSVRHRSSYNGDFSGFGATRVRRRIKPETVIDGQIGYDFQPGSALQGLSIFLQGLNLTDEPLISHEGFNEALTLNYEEYGRRFMLGATYKFGGPRAAPLPPPPPPPPPPPAPPATQTCADGSVVLATEVCPVPPPPPPPPPPAPERG